MITFDDLVFEDHPAYREVKDRIENDKERYGHLEEILSYMPRTVAQAPINHGRKVSVINDVLDDRPDTYELAVIEVNGDIEQITRGTKEEINEYLQKLQEEPDDAPQEQE